MTFKQAHELGAHVRQREKGSLVVYTDTVHKTETDEQTREDVEKAILFMKGYTVFNAEQVDNLPIHDYASRNGLPSSAQIDIGERQPHELAAAQARGIAQDNGKTQHHTAQWELWVRWHLCDRLDHPPHLDGTEDNGRGIRAPPRKAQGIWHEAPGLSAPTVETEPTHDELGAAA